MEKSRSQYVLKNSAIAFVTQIITMLMRFILQTVFIRQLGAYYLGINGLFSNILSILSIAELGIGTAIIFNLYKPIAVNDYRKISAYVNFYKKAYYIIGFIIFACGLTILPFITNFIEGDSVPNVHLIFFLFLINAVIGYFFTHKTTLFTASQRDYRNQINLFVFTMLQTILQIGILLSGRDYIYFLLAQIFCTLAANINISQQVDKEFKFIKENKKERISPTEYKIIKKNVMELIGTKFGGVLIQGSDNLLVSAFIGLRVVGLFSNYQLITNSIVSLQSRIINGTIASIGNLATEEDSEKGVSIYKKHFFVNFMITTFCGSMLLNLINPFITLWLGPEYTFSFLIVMLIILNYYVQQLRQTANSFLIAYGTLQFQGIKSIIEALFNLLISYILIKYTSLGIAGVLIGTITTNLFINSWFENFQVFRLGFKQSVNKYLVYQYVHMILGLLMMVVNYVIVSNLLSLGGILGLMLSAILTTVIMVCLSFIIFSRVEEFKSVKNLGMKFIKRKVKN